MVELQVISYHIEPRSIESRRYCTYRIPWLWLTRATQIYSIRFQKTKVHFSYVSFPTPHHPPTLGLDLFRTNVPMYRMWNSKCIILMIMVLLPLTITMKREVAMLLLLLLLLMMVVVILISVGGWVTSVQSDCPGVWQGEEEVEGRVEVAGVWGFRNCWTPNRPISQLFFPLQWAARTMYISS